MSIPPETVRTLLEDFPAVPDELPDSEKLALAAEGRVDRGEDTFVWVGKPPRKQYSSMCTKFICDVFKDAGIDHKYTENANYMVDTLKKSPEWEEIRNYKDTKRGDVVFVKGRGRSGKHAMVATEDWIPPKGPLDTGELIYAHDGGDYIDDLSMLSFLRGGRTPKLPSISKRTGAQLLPDEQDEYLVSFRRVQKK